MREVLPELLGWWREGRPVGMATVVATWRSAPRPAGASMLVGPDGDAVGSVSGGCVEGAVYELAQQVMADGRPVLQRYGVSDDDAFAVGLTCGGILDIYVERIDNDLFPQFKDVVAAIRTGSPVAVVTCVQSTGDDPEHRVGHRLIIYPDRAEGTLGTQRLDDAVTDDVRGMLAAGRTGVLRYGYDGERRGDESSPD